jgi:hypothetical protein
MDACRTLIYGAITIAAALQAQTTPTSSPRVLLTNLRDHLAEAKLTNCAAASNTVTAAGDADWLINRFNQTGWQKVPAEYTASLQSLANNLNRATSGGDKRFQCEVVSFIVRDLAAKRADCSTFGHARNNVRVEISTTHDGVPQKNWEVYVVWLPEGDRFTGIPRRLASLSSPAVGVIPFPGEFVIYAKHPSKPLTSSKVQVSVSGADPFSWQISVPAEEPPSLKR